MSGCGSGSWPRRAGNPLALLELPRGLTPAELAGGFGLPDAPGLSGRIEDSFRRRLAALPADTQRLLLVAAAEPVGDPVLVWRAAERLGIGVQAAADDRRAARDRRARDLSSPAGPLGCVSRGVAGGQAGGASRAGGRDRPRGRSRSPRLASCPSDAGVRRGRRRRARALGGPRSGTRRIGGGRRIPGTRRRADARTRAPSRASARRGTGQTPGRRVRRGTRTGRHRRIRTADELQHAQVDLLRGQIAFA